MLEKVLRLYQAFMVFKTTGLIPHLVGPAGSGKSSVVEELADLLGVQLHIINVSRLSPLEVEGVQMPVGNGTEVALHMLPATFWTRLREGDIVLLDEFLRGFPEVYNALLDIFTSRRAGAYVLPPVFIIAASNSMTTYDEALEDRMLHIAVPDPRKRVAERKRLAKIIVENTGMHPEMTGASEMEMLLDEIVLPTFDVLDQMIQKKGRNVASTKRSGKSVRNLISQVQLRYIETPQLNLLIEENNRTAMEQGKAQFVILTGVRVKVPVGYEKAARRLVGNPKLTPIQEKNLLMNLQLIELAAAKKEKDDD